MEAVLLIEDDQDIRENTCELLEYKGYRVFFADNGWEGLVSAKENAPDLILCDIMMPGMDGYELFNELKNDPKTSQIPFVFLTANTEKKEIEAGLKMGANGYIRKPFELEELFGTIGQCLDHKQTGEEFK